MHNSMYWPWPVWLSWLERCPANQRVVGSVLGQGTHEGFGFNPQLGVLRRRLMYVSLSPKVSLPSSHTKTSNEEHVFMFPV